MCGRIALVKTDKEKVKKRFKLKKAPEDLKPRYNIAPSQNIPVILNESPDELNYVRWGLIPSWAKEINTKYSMINARAESITEKPAYRGPIRHKRCLIIVDAFYEWQKTNGQKQPYCIRMKDDNLFAFAGIWDHWEKDGQSLRTCSIITTAANTMMQNIHERMPVILPADREEQWLSDLKLDEALQLLKPYDPKMMKAYEISTLVNSPSNDVAEVIEPAVSS